ncbi:DUF1972 domain-containing protein [Bacteroides intestinalis]|uniref:DUF1972 domain-containing protein n=1 Tax=Bacteroides intestinalis TaxID=329854 RepID=A0A414LGJ0_9BACE|nr:DUF1972 domain-containing protein [Bacteroides intestinalis]RHE93720.1 DUF1972 domain-containing protein [Bacteroides intestinalis]
MKQVAIVGIQGVPAKYGGFETLVENIIGDNCCSEVRYTVFCSGKDYATRMKTYKGAQLKYIPLFHANGIQSTPYDILSMLKCLRGYDAVVILGVSGCIFLPIFRLLYRKQLIVNIDGLEHRRAKWSKFARWFLRTSEAMAVRYADVVITDNKGIQDYVTDTYHKHSELIAYGGNHVLRDVPMMRQNEILEKYGLTKKEYAISICRIEPENNCHITLKAFAEVGQKLVFIGNWKYSTYGKELQRKYSKYTNICMLNAVYTLDVLYTLRNNARIYIHGHSAGGTNPSLVEAMFFGKPILAYDVIYNRETTENKACYFGNSKQLVELLRGTEENGEPLKEIAERRYTWRHISQQYEALYKDVEL